MTKIELVNQVKKTLATGTAVIAVAVGTVPAMASLTCTDYSGINIENSAMGTVVSDNRTTFNVKGKDISITKVDETNVDSSYVGTLVDSGDTTINAKGKNIDIVTAESTTFKDSVADTVLKQKTKTVNAKEVYKKGWKK
jgi:hypothetical protein